MKTIRRFKYFFVLMLIALVMIAVAGCSGSKIELSFEEDLYTVEVGKDILLEPIIKNEKGEEYTLVFSSETNEIATYIDGIIKGVAVGEVKVKVSLKDNDKIFAETTVEVVEATKFTVTFNTDGGTEVDFVQVIEGGKLTEINVPSKLGYEFVGWFTNEAKTIPFNFNAPINAAITLYAKWSINEYTVTFAVNEGSAVEEMTVNHGSKITTPLAPTKEGYIFKGWFIDEELSAVFDFDTNITANITLFAKWEIKVYEIVFNSNGGSVVEKASVAHGELLAEPTNPTKAGFNFVGWFANYNFTAAFDFENEAITDVIVLVAKWELDQVDASLITNGGVISEIDLIFNPKEGYEPTTQELGFFNSNYGSAYAETAIWLYDGDDYLFNGDSVETDKSWWGFKVALMQIGPKTFIVEKNLANETDVPQGMYDYILIGLWRPSTYSGFLFLQALTAGDILVIDGVDFEAEAGAVEGMITKYKETEIDNYYPLTIEPGTILPVPTKEGYVFVGWYDNASLTGESITTISKDTVATKFYAKFEAEARLEVSFVTGVEEINLYPILRIAGQTVKSPTVIRDGFTLVGWFTDEALSEAFDFNSPITESITLYAKWEENPIIPE